MVSLVIPTQGSVRRTKAKRSLSGFVRYMWPLVQPGKKLLWNWHHDALCEGLELVAQGSIRDLCICFPPRSGKSTIASVLWPAYDWLFCPHRQWLTSSYTKELATRDARRTREVMCSREYQELLNDIQGDNIWRFTGDQNVKTRYENTSKGHRVSTAPDAQATGDGGDIITTDDPNNVRKMIGSPMYRQSIIDWWTNTMMTRRNDPKESARVVIQQRNHQEDVIGHCLETGEYEVICFENTKNVNHKTPTTVKLKNADPRNHGELLDSRRIDEKTKKEMLTVMGSYGYESQYEQEPNPEEGQTFQRSSIRRYRKGTIKFDFMCWSWDFNAKGKNEQEDIEKLTKASYTVGWLIGVKEGKSYLITERRNRVKFKLKVEMVRNAARIARVKYQLIEDKAAGIDIIEQLEDEIPNLKRFEPGDRSKVQRALGCQGFIDNGEFFVPDEPWGDEVINEICGFPTWKYDDRVDTMTQHLLYLNSDRLLKARRKIKILGRM